MATAGQNASDLRRPVDVSRKICASAERELWGRAAARCEFSDCNKLLYKSPVTQESVNLAEMAHIYSFSKDGPRGWGPFLTNRRGLNLVDNLMLVCHDCHKKIDQDKSGSRYSAELLKQWKQEHEMRVRIATGIPPSKRSHVVLYGARIGSENSPIDFASAFHAMFPEWYPADDRPVVLSMQSSLEDGAQEFWMTEVAHLRKEFDRAVRVRVEEGKPNHFSVFALAPQPLLIFLGSLFTDKVPVQVYQPIREPRTWRRQAHPDDFRFIINEPADKTGAPAIVFSVSDKVHHDRIHSVLRKDVSIWELTSSDCHNDCLRSEAQLSEFRKGVRKLIVDIRVAHPHATNIPIFPVMPVACAIELGRVRMPKADLPWVIYDQSKEQKQFTEALTIGAADEQ